MFRLKLPIIEVSTYVYTFMLHSDSKTVSKYFPLYHFYKEVLSKTLIIDDPHEQRRRNRRERRGKEGDLERKVEENRIKVLGNFF